MRAFRSFFVCIASGVVLHAALPPWEMLEKSPGLQIEYRPDSLPGRHWVRGTLVDSVPMAIAGKVLLDVDRYTEWMDNLRISRIIQRISPDDYVLYQYYDLPWPLWDRDVYVRVRIERSSNDSSVTTIIEKWQNPDYPPIPGVIRVPSMYGILRLTAIGPNITRGEFTERMDLGGTVPLWAKAYLAKLTPAAILGQIRKACHDPRYRSDSIP